MHSTFPLEKVLNQTQTILKYCRNHFEQQQKEAQDPEDEYCFAEDKAICDEALQWKFELENDRDMTIASNTN